MIFVDILILARGSGAAQEELRSWDFREKERVGAAGSGSGSGHGSGSGRAAASMSSARYLAPTSTRMREVRPAQRIHA